MATPREALIKLKHYCAYQERCHKEVQQKLYDLKVWGEDAEEIIATLIQENFLNEERYACSYAGGKFRIKKWGRSKIRYALKRNQISDYCIRKAMKEIDDEEYMKTLYSLASKRYDLLIKVPYFKRKQKVRQYLIRKGYEYTLINQVIEELFQEK